MGAPSDISALRRLLGVVNHLGRFVLHLSDITAHIRALLQQTSAWVWKPAQQDAFRKVKGLLSPNFCMACYDRTYPTTVSAEATSYGFGAVQLQKQPTGEQRAVEFASRSHSARESRYSQTEELLSVAWASKNLYEAARLTYREIAGTLSAYWAMRSWMSSLHKFSYFGTVFFASSFRCCTFLGGLLSPQIRSPGLRLPHKLRNFMSTPCRLRSS